MVKAKKAEKRPRTSGKIHDPGRPSDREADIRERVQWALDNLYELYEATDPSKGKVSETGKLELARRAMDLWWYVHGKLLLWAQSQIVGYEVARSSPKFVDELIKLRRGEIDEDSHELELLGLAYVFNVPLNQEERVNALMDALEKIEGDPGLSDEVLRRIMVWLFSSLDANNSFWRFPLSRALRAANAGEYDPLFTPAKTRRRGLPYQLDQMRALAVAHVYFLVGQGIKKYVALERISEALAVSAETLRGWEKTLAEDDWFRDGWNAAQIAGQLGDDIKKKPILTPEEEYGISVADFWEARSFLNLIKDDHSLDRVKAGLRRFHAREEQ